MIFIVISGLSQKHLILGTKELKSVMKTFEGEQLVLPFSHRGMISIIDGVHGPALRHLFLKTFMQAFS